MDLFPKIYFYIPKAIFPDYVPASMEELTGPEWIDFCGQNVSTYTSILQTYICLRGTDLPCELTDALPNYGIILTVRGSIPDQFKPGKNQLMICMVGDATPHPYAQLQILQNPIQADLKKNGYYIPQWITPGLIPRDPARGDRFENIAFHGHLESLAPELRCNSWERVLRALGLNFQIIPPHRYHDYSNTDAVLAVRKFIKYKDLDEPAFLNKPALKLFNAWHAGVPAILPPESAYRAERRSSLDYIEVTSINEVVNSLKCLQANVELRRSMVTQGQVRAMETRPDQLVKRWYQFMAEVAFPTWQDWCRMPAWRQQSFLLDRYRDIQRNELNSRLSNLLKFRLNAIFRYL